MLQVYVKIRFNFCLIYFLTFEKLTQVKNILFDLYLVYSPYLFDVQLLFLTNLNSNIFFSENISVTFMKTFVFEEEIIISLLISPS